MPESNATKFALIKKEFEEIMKDISNFVTKSDFIAKCDSLSARISPLEKIVYGALTVILTGFMGAVVAFFIKK